MEHAAVNGVELEYEVTGSGEPLLLISPMLADGFLPLVTEPALAERHQLIRYHKRGWVGSTHPLGPVSVADHAADAGGLLAHLGIDRAHVAGHSSGAAVAAQLALVRPDVVRTLVLLELSIFTLPSGAAFLEQASPVLAAYRAGDHEGAIAAFLGAVSGLDWPTLRALLESRMPGSVARAVKDADTCFEVELPGLIEWTFDADHAASIDRPVLSVLGSRTQALWVEIAAFLRTAVPRVEECTIDGVGHLLHIEQPEPVARRIAQFLARHPMNER